ncbi:MAG: glycosyltransferase family 2 protein [Oscillatoriales cyanobacterium C42_A2020_001]|nr:glycosyltransferase family 2 protein [Leptolyngbyaceae cyanobacterium C42_A2020_001]
MPKVSILLINYNYARYLNERIQSLLNQTFEDFELIIIDNGSTDESTEIIGSYLQDPRIKPLFYRENEWIYKRWNDIADKAQGEYILFACSDDSCHPEFLEKLVEKLDQNPFVGLAYSQSWEIDDEGSHLYSLKEWTGDVDPDHWNKDYINNGKNECQYLFFKCTIPTSSAVLFRRSTFIEAGKFDETMPFASDWMLYAKVLAISDVAFVSEHLNYRRTDEKGLRNTSEKDVFVEESIKVIHFLSHNAPPPKYFSKKVFEPLIGWWIRSIAAEGISFDRNRRIYILLKDIEPSLNFQLAKHFIKTFQRKLKLA